MFKNLANLGSIMQQAQQMGGKMEEIQGKLKTQRVKAAAGGGMVEVEMNGLGQMLSLSIEPNLVENNDREMIEDLVPAAVNEAIQKAKELHVAEMKNLTDDINLPGLDAAIAKFTGSGVG